MPVFLLGLRNLLCIFTYSTSPFEPATVQVLDGPMWLPDWVALLCSEDGKHSTNITLSNVFYMLAMAINNC